MKEITLFLMAVLYIAAGLNHFVNPRFYAKIIPPLVPLPKAVNYMSGLAEIVLGGMLLYEPYSHLAAWGIIALLIAVFPANIYHYMIKVRKGDSEVDIID